MKLIINLLIICRDRVTKPTAQIGFIKYVLLPLFEALNKVSSLNENNKSQRENSSFYVMNQLNIQGLSKAKSCFVIVILMAQQLQTN